MNFARTVAAQRQKICYRLTEDSRGPIAKDIFPSFTGYNKIAHKRKKVVKKMFVMLL